MTYNLLSHNFCHSSTRKLPWSSRGWKYTKKPHNSWILDRFQWLPWMHHSCKHWPSVFSGTSLKLMVRTSMLLHMFHGLHIEIHSAIWNTYRAYMEASGWTRHRQGIASSGTADSYTSKGTHPTRTRHAHQVSAQTFNQTTAGCLPPHQGSTWWEQQRCLESNNEHQEVYIPVLGCHFQNGNPGSDIHPSPRRTKLRPLHVEPLKALVPWIFTPWRPELHLCHGKSANINPSRIQRTWLMGN